MSAVTDDVRQAHTGTDTGPIRVIILDDHQSILDGYRFRLNQSADIEVVATANIGSELEMLIAQHQADVAILDVSVPTAADNPSPFPIQHVIPRLLTQHPELAILIVSMYAERGLIDSLLQAGASGYILKDDRDAVERLAEIVRSVAQGGLYLSPQVRKKMERAAGEQARILTLRQLEALSLAASHPDWSRAELAAKMCVSNSTVRNLLSGAYLRLQVNNLAAAVMKARHLGLLASAP